MYTRVKVNKVNGQWVVTTKDGLFTYTTWVNALDFALWYAVRA